MDRPLLIHIGYHKTGTTWMQRRLFRPGCGYVPLMDHAAVEAHLTGPHPLVFEPGAARAEIAARLAAPQNPGAEQGGAGQGGVAVISSELLSGHPFRGGRESAEFARRLAAAAPGARILITIRAQVPMIASVYMQYLRRGGRLPAERFFAGPPAPGFPGFDPAHFEYDRLVALYRGLFDADRVKVMTQERLAADPAGFVAELAAFAGAAPGLPVPAAGREGASEREALAGILRRINQFRRTPAGPDPALDLGPLSEAAYRAVAGLGRRPPVARLTRARPVRDLARARFAGRFAASNRRLAEMTGGDPDLAGYER